MSDTDPVNRFSLLHQLVACQCLKFGQFKLKSGAMSEFYLDLREVTRFPDLWRDIVRRVGAIVDQRPKSSAPLAIVGVPYGVWPVAAAVSFEKGLPYCPIRKEVKTYGQSIDLDSWKQYDFILIEDVITTGSSIVETIESMKGLNITDIIILADRRIGLFKEKGLECIYPNIRLHTIININDVLELHKGQTSSTE